MKPYSPTQTVDFMANPVNWRIKREGWTPLVYKRPEVALAAGSAFQAGVASWYAERRRLGARPPFSEIAGAVDVLKKSLAEELAEIRSNGITWQDDCVPTLESLPMTLEKTLTKVLMSDPIPVDWEILEVESMWSDCGYAKPDLVLKTPSGQILASDFKYKQQLDQDRVPQTLSEYAYSWQFMHYAWATEKRYETIVTSHGLCLVASRPYRCDPHYFPIDPVLKELWYVSARSAWAVMAAIDGEPHHLQAWIEENGGVLPPWHPFLFHTRYGLDKYGEAVLYHKLDPYLMAQSYVNTKATGDEPGAPEVSPE